MNDDEGLRFETGPLCKAILKMRTFDEAAKVVGMTVPGLDAYATKINALLEAATAKAEVPVHA